MRTSISNRMRHDFDLLFLPRSTLLHRPSGQDGRAVQLALSAGPVFLPGVRGMNALATYPDDLKRLLKSIIDNERDSLTDHQIFMVLLELSNDIVIMGDLSDAPLYPPEGK